MPKAVDKETLAVNGREIAISNPRKVLFPQAGHTKLDLARYYLAVADGALRGAGGRPNVLVRYPNGTGGEFFFQKRAPESRLPWIEVVTLSFPSGRTAEEVVPRDAAALIWMANLACLELHPHPVRAEDLDHPDELRVDLDPVPGVEWPQIRDVAKVVRATLEDFGLVGWPKTSGSRGIHVYVRIERRWAFDQVRRAALAFAREVERRAPGLATSKWWKEERHGVFLDYNQNAKDRTIASAYSVRPTADARVSAPLAWEEIDDCNPADFTLATMLGRFAAIGDRHAGIDDRACSLDRLLELSTQQERDGLGDAPWPPNYKKQAGEPPRVQPSKKRTSKYPLIEIGRSPKKEEALAGVERWKARHAEAAAHLEPADILVDAMRGRFKTWTRTRINLQHVPEALRPVQEALDPDETPNEWSHFMRASKTVILIGLASAAAAVAAQNPPQAGPPVRDPLASGYVKAIDLPDGAVPPVDQNGNFIIGATHPPSSDMTAKDGVPKGTVHTFTMSSADSRMYPGIAREAGTRGQEDPSDPAKLIVTTSHPAPYTRQVAVYVPSQYASGTIAPLIVGADGPDPLLFTTLDNLIAQKRVPAMIAVSIANGSGDAQGSQRGLEYDTMSGRYAEFVETEVLPLVEKQYNVKLTRNPDSRATMGCSSGAAAALSMAWYRTDLYHRVLSYSGTYVNQQWPFNAETPGGAWEYHRTLIPNNPAKPIRIWMHVSDRDNLSAARTDGMHDWVLANENMAKVLAAKNYEYQFVFARNAGHCDRAVKLQTLPQALEWVWRGHAADAKLTR